jgi:hypothetical protein
MHVRRSNADSTPCVQRVADGDRSWRYRVQLSRPIPADLAVLVADAIHNMRSALDQVAYHLADRHVGGLTADQERTTEFPIKTTAQDFDGWMRERRRGDLYGPNESRALRCVQPFALQEEAAGYGLTVGHDLTDDAAVVLNALWNSTSTAACPGCVGASAVQLVVSSRSVGAVLVDVVAGRR